MNGLGSAIPWFVVACIAAGVARWMVRLALGAEVQVRLDGLVTRTWVPAIIGQPLTRWCDAADVAIPERWLATTVAGAVAAGIVGCAGSVVTGLIGFFAVLAVRVALLVGRARSAPSRVERAMPAFLDAIAVELRSGVTVVGALRDLQGGHAAIGADLAWLNAQLRFGATVDEALQGWAARSDGDGVRAGVAALRIAHQRGGALAPVLEHLAATLRERLGALADLRTQSLQVRLSALVVAAAPLLYLAFSISVDPRSAALLVTTSVGRWCLVVGLGADALAWWWITRIVQAPL